MSLFKKLFDYLINIFIFSLLIFIFYKLFSLNLVEMNKELYLINNCKVIKDTSISLELGFGNFGGGIFVTPPKKVYKCDNGVIYER